MKRIILERQDIYRGDLLLVNAKYPLRNYMAEDLSRADLGPAEILLKRAAVLALQRILKKISADSQIVPISGYRSLEEQKEIFGNSLRENGEEFTRKYVALPDCSEHQTGLAIDLGLNMEEIDFICPDFPCEGICEEFRKVAPDYGFILRYTKEKEEMTGISHEPWHFRYVGIPHAKIMAEKGLCLEEYTEYIKRYGQNGKFVYKNAAGDRAEIYYVSAEEDKTQITIPKGCVYQISGNNVDGFVVTVWRGRDDKE